MVFAGPSFPHTTIGISTRAKADAARSVTSCISRCQQDSSRGAHVIAGEGQGRERGGPPYVVCIPCEFRNET